MESKPDIKMNTYWYPSPAEWEIHRRLTLQGLVHIGRQANYTISKMKCPLCNQHYAGIDDVEWCDFCGIVVCKACSREDGKQTACKKHARCLEPKADTLPVIGDHSGDATDMVSGNDFLDHLRTVTAEVEQWPDWMKGEQDLRDKSS